jgi:hypothetical protein
MAKNTLDKETEFYRNELADRMDVHPVTEWSPQFLRAVIALLDLEVKPPAPVLQLVGPRKAPRS